MLLFTRCATSNASRHFKSPLAMGRDAFKPKHASSVSISEVIDTGVNNNLFMSLKTYKGSSSQCPFFYAILIRQEERTLLFTPVSITPLIDTEDACFDLNASRPIAKGDLKWRDALLVAHRVNSNR